MSAERHKTGAAGESTVDIDALRARYRDERDKRLRADGNDAVRRGRRRVRAATSTTPTSSPASPASRSPTRSRCAIIGGGFGGLLARRAPARGRRRGHPHHREGRRLRRHLVLEPLPRRGLRRRVLHLPAAARRDRLHAEGEVLRARRRSSSTAARIGRALRPLRATPASRPRSPSCAGTSEQRAGSSRPTAATACSARFVVHGQRPAEPAEAAGHPRHRDASRATPSTPAAGTTTTPAATPTAA